MCHGAILAGTRVEAAFFSPLFFAAAKKRGCRPAQGQRLRREAHRGCQRKSKNTTEIADASETGSKPTSAPRNKKANLGSHPDWLQDTARRPGP
jgi:hypothetical protein